MQSIATQVTDIALPIGEQEDIMIVPARDFMRVRLISHQLSEEERADMAKHEKELKTAMVQWSEGGVWVEDRDEQKQLLARDD